MKIRSAFVFVLCALSGSMVLSCSDDNKSEDVVSAELTVDPSAIQIKEGESKSFTIHYNPSTDLVVTSGNSECVTLDGQDNKIVTTNSDSHVSVNVTAIGQDCTSVITVADRGDAAISKTIQVTVEATQLEPPVLDKPELIVSPMTLVFDTEGNSPINITYAEKADLLITSLDPDCVKVNDAAVAEITTNAEGKAEVMVMAVGEGCSSIVTVMDKEDSTISKNVNISVLGAGEEMPILTLTPDSLSLTPGGSDTAVANYKLEKSGTAIAKKFLELSSTNPACAGPASESVETDANGNADIKVIAKDGGSCKAMITVKPPMGTSKSINVSVFEGDEPGPVVGNGSLAFDPTSLTIAFSEKTGNIVLNYKDGNGAGVANANVIFDYDDNCIKSDKLKKAKTDDNGQIAMVLTAQKDDCTTTLTAKSGDVTASAEIAVTAKTEFSFTLETAIDESKYDKIGYLTVGTSDLSCAAFADGTGLKKASEDIATEEQMDINGTSPILSTYLITEVPIAQKSVLVVGKANPSSKATKAYGCKDISEADDGQTVHLDLAVVPTEIKGTYDVVTNFDFTDAIQPSGEVLIEKMTGGDWLKLLLDFIDDPGATMMSFIWNNSLEILNEDELFKQTLAMYFTSTSQTIMLNYFAKVYDDYLKICKIELDTEKLCSDVIKDDLSPIIDDLSTNMQLFGRMEIAETDDVSAINKGNEEFTEVQYIWPFTTNRACVPNAYGKTDVKCRNRMLLAKANDGNVQSVDWTGKWADEKLTINTHSLSFKWASILASVVVIEILPAVFDYKGNNNYKAGNYFSALIDKFGFDLIINAYNKKHAEDAERYPELESGTTISSCAKAIEAMAIMVTDSAKSAGSMIVSVADSFVCSYVSELDKYVWDALGKVEASTDNALTLEAKDCALSEASLVEGENPFDGMYTRMGTPDDPVVTAHEVFGEDKKFSSRCTWELKIGSMDEPMKGLFHTIRTK